MIETYQIPDQSSIIIDDNQKKINFFFLILKPFHIINDFNFLIKFKINKTKKGDFLFISRCFDSRSYVSHANKSEKTKRTKLFKIINNFNLNL